jgi:hypothetical protein
MLGRVCPEKGIHLGIQAAQTRGIPLIIAGETFPYEAHHVISTRRSSRALTQSAVSSARSGFRPQAPLLSAARCVLILACR